MFRAEQREIQAQKDQEKKEKERLKREAALKLKQEEDDEVAAMNQDFIGMQTRMQSEAGEGIFELK